jgi:hypothetical protein
MCRSNLSLTSSLDGVHGQRYAPATFLLGKRHGVHFYRKLVRSHSRSERVGKISPLPVFDLRTVQPVISRYAD